MLSVPSKMNGSLKVIEEELENWRISAQVSLFGEGENDEVSSDLGLIYTYLLNALWSDPLSFQYLSGLRLKQVESDDLGVLVLCVVRRL